MSLDLQQLAVEELSIPERLELIGILWDSITDADPHAPAPEWHLRELARRHADADARPEAGIPWEEVKGRLSGSP